MHWPKVQLCHNPEVQHQQSVSYNRNKIYRGYSCLLLLYTVVKMIKCIIYLYNVLWCSNNEVCYSTVNTRQLKFTYCGVKLIYLQQVHITFKLLQNSFQTVLVADSTTKWLQFWVSSLCSTNIQTGPSSSRPKEQHLPPTKKCQQIYM